MRCAASAAMRSICRWRRLAGARGRPSSPSPCRATCSTELVGASGLPSLLRRRRAAARPHGADRRSALGGALVDVRPGLLAAAPARPDRLDAPQGEAAPPTPSREAPRAAPPRRPSRRARAAGRSPPRASSASRRRRSPAAAAPAWLDEPPTPELRSSRARSARAGARARPSPGPRPSRRAEQHRRADGAARAGPRPPPARARAPPPRRSAAAAGLPGSRATTGCKARSTACSASPRASPSIASTVSASRVRRTDRRHRAARRPARCRRGYGRAARTPARRGRRGSVRGRRARRRPSRRSDQAMALAGEGDARPGAAGQLLDRDRRREVDEVDA